MNIGLKHTILYIFGILSSIILSSIVPIQLHQLNQHTLLKHSQNKETKVEVDKSTENDFNHYFSQSPISNKQNTYRRCYQANSLVRETSVISLTYCTHPSEIQSKISSEIESYFIKTRDIEISLPIQVLVYPFNYFW